LSKNENLKKLLKKRGEVGMLASEPPKRPPFDELAPISPYLPLFYLLFLTFLKKARNGNLEQVSKPVVRAVRNLCPIPM
jgi:hypothetical protein